MPIKFLVLGGGGYFGFFGGGGSADFIYMGARIFLKIARQCTSKREATLIFGPFSLQKVCQAL